MKMISKLSVFLHYVSAKNEGSLVWKNIIGFMSKEKLRCCNS